MPGKILLMDNQVPVLDKWGELLEQDGYHVIRASTLEKARSVLEHQWIHLAILDIRMTDEDDENDISGLLLAQEPQFSPIPKIVLTAYPSYKYVRMVLAPDAEGQTPAINFIAKAEGPQALRQAIESAFADQVRLNWDLQIHWDQREHLSFLYLANLLQPGLVNDMLVHRADELEDLLRRLFYDYQQIRTGRLLWHAGRRFCLTVLAQSPQGATDPRIIVCGERERLGRELARMRELAPETIRGTQLLSTTETMHFGAASYLLPDADVETVQTLRELFQRGKERPLKTAFNHLLKKVLAAWHQHGQMVKESRDLMSLYRQSVGLEEDGLSRTEVERRVEALVQAARPLSAVDVQRDDGAVTFHFPNEAPLTCPDPVATAYTPLKGHVTPAVCRISPGQLTADNVLVDAGHQTWLTDFGRAGQAPQSWDFVCLEAIIRFDLSQAPDLLAWQEFEECLVVPDRLHDRLRSQDVIADLRTSIVLIEQIRRQASSKTGSDPLPYYAGLLVWAVGAMARYDPAALYTQTEKMRAAHLLLAASMLARRLGEKFSASLPGGILRLGDDDTIWIGDRRVGNLGGQELALLRCLYERADQPVDRQTIVESVFGEKYSAGDKHQDSRINSLVRRLRVKIEPNPNRPHYILTVKGKGYRLQINN